MIESSCQQSENKVPAVVCMELISPNHNDSPSLHNSDNESCWTQTAEETPSRDVSMDRRRRNQRKATQEAIRQVVETNRVQQIKNTLLITKVQNVAKDEFMLRKRSYYSSEENDMASPIIKSGLRRRRRLMSEHSIDDLNSPANSECRRMVF